VPREGAAPARRMSSDAVRLLGPAGAAGAAGRGSRTRRDDATRCELWASFGHVAGEPGTPPVARDCHWAHGSAWQPCAPELQR